MLVTMRLWLIKMNIAANLTVLMLNLKDMREYSMDIMTYETS